MSSRNVFWGHGEHFFADAANLKKCNPFNRNACFGRCWASSCALFLLTFCICFLCCFLDGLFARFWRIWASKKGPCWGPFWQFLQILHEKKRAAIEARKLMIFGGLFGGAGGRGQVCLSLQILQNGEKIHSRPAPPAGVRRILRLRPCRRPPIN